MGRTAETQRGLLKVKQEEADAALGDIQSSMETAAERRKEVEVLGRELADKQVIQQEQRGGSTCVCHKFCVTVVLSHLSLFRVQPSTCMMAALLMRWAWRLLKHLLFIA
jgi:hypothetical protein